MIETITKELVGSFLDCCWTEQELAGYYGANGVKTTAVLDGSGQPSGARQADSFERVWTVARELILGPKYWDLHSKLCTRVSPSQPESLAAIAFLDAHAAGQEIPDRETIAAARLAAKGAINAAFDLRNLHVGGELHAREFVPFMSLFCLEEQLRGRVRRGDNWAFLAIKAVAERPGENAQTEYQFMLDTMIQYYVDAGLA